MSTLMGKSIWAQSLSEVDEQKVLIARNEVVK